MNSSPLTAPAERTRSPKWRDLLVLAWRSLSTLAILACCPSIFAQNAPQAAEPKMSWLDNGVIKLGIDLNLGGAITWLSKSGDSQNVINSWDWGRQVQMSFYSGPVPFIAGEKRPAKNWEGLGWNPIQVGDCFGHRAQVLEQTNDGAKIYVRCLPMQWPLENVPGECTFESWLELRGACVVARGRLNNARADRTQFAGRGQELPAVYTNGPFHRLMTYNGARPFCGEPVTQLTAKPPPGWDMWLATENWSALVNDAGWGLGVWSPETVQYGGGFNGAPGQGGPKDSPCGYLAPNRAEILDHNIAYDFRYELILGTVEEIRAEVYRQSRGEQPARWAFQQSRHGWIYANATDAGWPIKGELAVRWDHGDPQLLSPRFFREAPATAVVLEAAAPREMKVQLFWSTLTEPGLSPQRSVTCILHGDGAMREHRLELPAVPGLVQLRLDPPGGAGELRVKSVRVE